jgi:hypothetical protein
MLQLVSPRKNIQNNITQAFNHFITLFLLAQVISKLASVFVVFSLTKIEDNLLIV